MYKKTRNTKKTLAAAPRLTAEQYARPRTQPLTDEVGIEAHWETLCVCCDGYAGYNDGIYYIPKTGLSRHVQCEPTDDYLARRAMYYEDLRITEHNEEVRIINLAVKILAQQKWIQKGGPVQVIACLERFLPKPEPIPEPEPGQRHLRLVK